jgi:hypothetical protein
MIVTVYWTNGSLVMSEGSKKIKQWRAAKSEAGYEYVSFMVPADLAKRIRAMKKLLMTRYNVGRKMI